MVLSQLAATLINKFLSPFVDELAAEQLNVFAWSGQVSLKDVSIKRNAFDSLNLPFRVVHGTIGKIQATVPWTNIYTESIVINISDVYIVAIPNAEIRFDPQAEEQYEWDAKKKFLDNIEKTKQQLQEGMLIRA